MKIMVIDDDSTFLFIFRKQVERFEEANIINESKNGAEALNYIQNAIAKEEGIPDLIVLDLNMPIVDGWGFLDEFSRISESSEISIPVCILSSTINQSDFDKANTYHLVKSFLSKPITSDQFKVMQKLAERF